MNRNVSFTTWKMKKVNPYMHFREENLLEWRDSSVAYMICLEEAQYGSFR